MPDQLKICVEKIRSLARLHAEAADEVRQAQVMCAGLSNSIDSRRQAIQQMLCAEQFERRVIELDDGCKAVLTAGCGPDARARVQVWDGLGKMVGNY